MIMKKPTNNWKECLPQPVCDEFPEYQKLYSRAWELAHTHIRDIKGMPQNPYMDEGLCDTQIWIWDTCFMALFCKYAQNVFPGKESFKNFYEVLYNGRDLPLIMPTEKEPSWTGAKSGVPYRIQVHIADNPPLFSWAEYENALIHGDKQYLAELMYEKKSLQRHYEWLENLKENEKIPNVFCKTRWLSEERGYKWEGGCSGMDNTPRGRKSTPTVEDRPNNPDMLWIDAICEQALSARMISDLFKILKDTENAKEWRLKFEEKKNIVNEYYWDEQDGFYYDIDSTDGHFYKVKTIASYWALTAGIADKKRAEKMINYLTDKETFGGDIPFVTLARNDADFSKDGRYWRGGVWLPCAYAVLKGLEQYGHYNEAHDLALKLLSHMSKTYERYSPHTIWECYSPTKPEPATRVNDKGTVRPDFCGWSALGPISVYIEFVLGFRTINAFENEIVWEKPREISGNIGIRNLEFGDIVTDIVANGNKCTVVSDKEYTLRINGRTYFVKQGRNFFDLSVKNL